MSITIKYGDEVDEVELDPVPGIVVSSSTVDGGTYELVAVVEDGEETTDEDVVTILSSGTSVTLKRVY